MERCKREYYFYSAEGVESLVTYFFMNICCQLGRELIEKKNILYESENFFIVPTVGQMGIEGYILLCSKKHYYGLGDVPREYETELEEILVKIKKVLFDVYGSKILIFEHGPRLGCYKGGGCIEHAHMHLVPTDTDIIDFLSKKFKIKKLQTFDELRDIFNEKNLLIYSLKAKTE